MLVALDTAQLIQLADPRMDPAVVREFRDTWEARGCVLALNETTLREFVHGGGSNLSHRHGLLESFISIRGIPHPNQLYEDEFDAHVSALALDVPLNVYLPDVLSELSTRHFRTLDSSSLQAAVDDMRNKSEKRREFDGVVAQGLDLIRMLGKPWPPQRLLSMTKDEAVRACEDFTANYPEPLRTQQRELRVRLLDAFYRDPSNRRQFMTLSCDVAELAISRTAPYEDFHEIAYLKQMWFARSAPEILYNRGLITSPEQARNIMSKLSPYMLPGVSLRLAMLREQARDRTRAVEPGDVADNVSLMFAPYVHLACVDKRVFQWVQRARSSKQTDLLFEDVGANLVDARSLAHVTKAIALH